MKSTRKETSLAVPSEEGEDEGLLEKGQGTFDSVAGKEQKNRSATCQIRLTVHRIQI